METHPAGPPAGILIVEDERVVARDLQQSLQGMGYDAFAVASSSDEALACVARRTPDLALVDVRIKGDVDGIDTALAMRDRFDVPVVFLTAHADDATVQRAARSTPLGYLVKPIRAAELKSAVEISLYKHQMEVKLRQSERWFSTTLRSLADAVVAVDREGRVRFLNAAAEQVLGLVAAQALGQPVEAVLRLVDRAGAPLISTPLRQALAHGDVVQGWKGSLQAPGSRRPLTIQDSVAPIVDAGLPLGAVIVFRDVTAQEESARRLELTDRLAALGTIAAGVGHEVNTPLSVIAANVNVLQDLTRTLAGLADEAEAPLRLKLVDELDELDDTLVDVASAVKRIDGVVADLRAFTHPVVSGDAQCDVARAVDWALRSTAHELHYRTRVVTHLEPTPKVALDEPRLGQVLVSLLVNAGHAIAPGKRDQHEVTVSARPEGAGQVRLEVRDTGSGIPPELLPRVFEPFFTTRAPGAGAGLGLSVSHAIVTAAGGSIDVASEVGRGTTFTVLLPAAHRQDDRSKANRSG